MISWHKLLLFQKSNPSRISVQTDRLSSHLAGGF